MTLLSAIKHLEMLYKSLNKPQSLWFENNWMKPNTDKCYLAVSGRKYKHRQK